MKIRITIYIISAILSLVFFFIYNENQKAKNGEDCMKDYILNVIEGKNTGAIYELEPGVYHIDSNSDLSHYKKISDTKVCNLYNKDVQYKKVLIYNQYYCYLSYFYYKYLGKK